MSQALRRHVLPRQCAVARCPGMAWVGSRCSAHSSRTRGWPGTPMPPGWPRLRAQVLAEEPDCRVCGRPATTVDHVLARRFGGSNDRTNLRSLCARHAHEKNQADALEGGRRARARRSA
jgi:5-methylcytosine-specific restriction endonuclease McrA